MCLSMKKEPVGTINSAIPKIEGDPPPMVLKTLLGSSLVIHMQLAAAQFLSGFSITMYNINQISLRQILVPARGICCKYCRTGCGSPECRRTPRAGCSTRWH